MALPFREIHLDFHTSEHIPEVGRDFDPEEFVGTLKKAHVNSITCFSRCHHGMIYHDTKFEARHPHLTRNLLAEQIEACHRNGIRIPIYITVGLDEFMSTRHPEWIEMNCDGVRSAATPLQAGWHKLCFNENSPYIDYVVAQTEEVLDIFGDEVDGLFFDIISQGECCCFQCMAGMQKAGYDPTVSADRSRYAARMLDSFKERMTSAVRAKNRRCTIFYNAGHVGPAIRPSLSNYSHLELESLPSGGWGYEHFPITSRYARNLGYEIIGCTGKFLKSWADFGGFKNPAALEYECFSALAMGGKCMVGDQLHPTGKITAATYDLIGGVYTQVEQREPWCAESKAVAEIGVVSPEVITAGAPHSMNETAAGVYRMLRERQYQFDFVDFEMDLSRYKVIVLPDVIRLTREQAAILNSYLAQGGKILASYASGMGHEGFKFLLDDMPAVVDGEAKFSPDFLTASEKIGEGVLKSEHVMYERGFELRPAAGAQGLAEVWKPYFERTYEHFCSHFHTPVEGPAGYPGIVANDKIVYVGYPIFGMYKRHGARAYRDMTLNALELLLSDEEKLVRTDAPTTAELLLNYQPAEDRYVLHALHYVPEKRYGIDTIEDIIPLYNVNVSLALPAGYESAQVALTGAKIDATRSGGRLSFVIPEVRGHAMISITR